MPDVKLSVETDPEFSVVAVSKPQGVVLAWCLLMLVQAKVMINIMLGRVLQLAIVYERYAIEAMKAVFGYLASHID